MTYVWNVGGDIFCNKILTALQKELLLLTQNLSSHGHCQHDEVYSIQHYVIVCLWLATGRCFYLGTSISSTNKTDRHDITEILLKVALNTITLTQHCQTVHISILFSETIGPNKTKLSKKMLFVRFSTFHVIFLTFKWLLGPLMFSDWLEFHISSA
jgi:hypothetical protein